MREDARTKSFISERSVIAFVVLFSTLALAYFYVVDRVWLSTRQMAPIFRYLLIFQDAKAAWMTVAISLGALVWRYPGPILKVVDFCGNRVRTVTFLATGVLAGGSIVIYHDHALSMDEYAAVFQAKVFASGRLFAQLPPTVVDWLLPSGFNGFFIIASRVTGRAIECYWPGFAALLAPFEWLGVPWLCNAVLSGLAVLLVHRITLRITDDPRAAGWAVLFTLCSGVFLAIGISYYSMQAHLTANLLFVWLLMNPTPRRSFLAGVVGSLALVLHNPFPHTLFALPWIIALARSNELRRAFFALASGYLPLLIVAGAGWLQLRAVVTEGGSGFNFVGSNLSGDFSLPDEPIINYRLAAMVKMWIWAVPGLFLFAVLGRLRWGGDSSVRLMTQSALLTFAGYLFVVFDQGHGWGYRYFHSAWGVVPILAACALSRAHESDTRLVTFAGASALLSVALIVPLQMSQIEAFVSSQLAQLPKVQHPGNNVYFVAYPGGFYTIDLVQMDPLLRTRDLILVSRGPVLDAELRRQNWPDARLVGKTVWADAWNLGAEDQRRVREGSGPARFELSFADPSAAALTRAAAERAPK